MIKKFFKLLGIYDYLKDYEKKNLIILNNINQKEDFFIKMTDEELKNYSLYLKEQVSGYGKSISEVLVDAYALVREASKRVLGKRPYDVQILGAIILNDGKIAEMKTGEGKTLVAAFPTYLNALTGKGVHVVTVNEYLAKRDKEQIGKIHEFLGLTVGVIYNEQNEVEKKNAYNCDITYGTNNEFGFDYLKDNLKSDLSLCVQRGHNYVIIDEVDSILIDEARTPLIISSEEMDRSDFYINISNICKNIPIDYIVIDEKFKTVMLNEVGMQYIEKKLQENHIIEDKLYETHNTQIVHNLNQALKAIYLFQKDKDYLIKDDEILIIDEFTGRVMDGRRYAEGLHQSIEAKEGVPIKPETSTLSSITYQNLFRMYEKLSGMTGTALTEADEFAQVYGLDVVSVPTNKEIKRIDEEDEIYLNSEFKYNAIIKEIIKAKEKKQPVLVGTTSVEKSEIIASRLEKAGFKRLNFNDINSNNYIDKIYNENVFQVLNAKEHEHEAFIVAQAGIPGAITIATNMAGRGTDIQLGGNPEFFKSEDINIKEKINNYKNIALEAGGLYVIGTERNESRRIDNQLRGRSGRQGDVGYSKFFVSMEDDVARVFMSAKLKELFPSFGLKDENAIRHNFFSKALEKAQMSLESHNFDIRKNVIKLDDVLNEQRKAFYKYRQGIMSLDDVSEMVDGMFEEVIRHIVYDRIPEKSYKEQWDVEGIIADIFDVLGMKFDLHLLLEQNDGWEEDDIIEQIMKNVNVVFSVLTDSYSIEGFNSIKKQVLLRVIDKMWKEHISNMEYLRSVIGFRGYAQRDPIVEFRTEGFEMYEQLTMEIAKETVRMIMTIRPPITKI